LEKTIAMRARKVVIVMLREALMVASLLVVPEHIMIRLVKAMKLHVNYVQLVPTAQAVVEIILMCASNARLEHTMIKLVGFDHHDNDAKRYFDSNGSAYSSHHHITPHQLFHCIISFKLFHQVKQNANPVILVHLRHYLNRPFVMYVLVGHMVTSLASRSVSNVLIVSVVQMEVAYAHFVLITFT
jgi:hypothetical protein